MPRRVKQSPSIFEPLMDNLVRRLSGSNPRFRRKLVRYGFWGIGLIFAYSLLFGTYGIPRIIRLELERRSLVEANRTELINLVDADRIRKLLLSDPEYIEKLARTRYRMVYPDETIYRYRGQ